MKFEDQRPIKRLEASPLWGQYVPDDTWPGTLPAVAALRDGLDLGTVTVLVGENGSGKSTLIEGIAMAFGLNAEGGSTHANHQTRVSESALSRALRVVRSPGASRWGYFLRAETMHGLYTYLEDHPSPHDAAFHEMSHGESFLEVLRQRFDGSGLFVLDEPESALSFTSCLALVAVLHELAATGTAQILVATHSPVVAALPGARILEVGAHGLRETTWDELDLVRHHRTFLDDPGLYLRHLLG